MACAPYPLSLGSKHPLRGHPLRTGGSQQPRKQSDQKTACWDRVRKPTCRRIPAGLRRVSAATTQMSRRKRDCVSDGPADPQMAREGSCLHEPKANPLSSRSPGMRRFLPGFPRTRGDAGQRGLQTRGGGAGTRTRLRCTLCALVLTAGPARSFCYSCPFLQRRNPGSSTRAHPRSHWCTQAEGGWPQSQALRSGPYPGPAPTSAQGQDFGC